MSVAALRLRQLTCSAWLAQLFLEHLAQRRLISQDIELPNSRPRLLRILSADWRRNVLTAGVNKFLLPAFIRYLRMVSEPMLMMIVPARETRGHYDSVRADESMNSLLAKIISHFSALNPFRQFRKRSTALVYQERPRD